MIIERCADAVSVAKEKGQSNVCYMSNLLRVHITNYTIHIYSTVAGEWRQRAQHTFSVHSHAKFFSLLENQFILYSYIKLHTFTHNTVYTVYTKEWEEKHTHYIIHFRVSNADHRNETKKSGKFRTKKCYWQKNSCDKAWGMREGESKNVTAIFICFAFGPTRNCETVRLRRKKKSACLQTRVSVYMFNKLMWWRRNGAENLLAFVK